ncbi:MATE family efflux transporter [Romboutsia sp. 1001216sp1]|uniref:MATE family efflux transporter n=1 Tax=Romboutsia sp. 1001216sp1 TaxID=2986997 RepID=UPI0023309B24|nr:MATE family efflux transporter [Romboutsia sp. 1001216sp1]MDB8805281.1 MATE family efflux transporter [Romboutsia sp. 1001216sp1]MDB8807045.1 MATE family efflux transporter [Romboutsia sp. 1001216sp1]MDB8810926.1 MATE family efflux transporter [Romboutsia sp. 1001216sp1]MDB8816646.1 MATE family efflux transporter [Romboutsia sp. 1001216sp1]MDB8819069.1 MATE family efflux transporter [Romboutsia sp. 1001216sp1]
MSKVSNFTEGKIFSPLLKFAIPILLALFLQTMYGAVDLLIVGQFGNAADVSAVSTGSQVMMTITVIITGLTMGLTILIGQKLGEGNSKEAGNVVGSGISIFAIIAIVITVLIVSFASPISTFMHTPKEAFDSTVMYIKVCASGSIFIVAYNIIGGVFRGLGDSKTPLITVGIACVTNIIGDLIFVGIFKMAATGAALATIMAQAISVILSVIIIKKRGLPFEFFRKSIKFHKGLTSKIIKYGTPIALQDGLVHLSFLVIMIIGNSMGVIPSAGIGVAEKLVGFIMLIPSSFSQAVSAFVAQNYGAKKYHRSRKVLVYAISASLCCGVVMFYITFFHGNLLAGMFSKDKDVVLAAWEYMKAYGIDCLLTAIMFCMVGYFNGCGKTTFVMIQGIIGAFGVRIPVSYIMSKILPVSLFKVGLATPMSTFVQIILCVIYFMILSKKLSKEETPVDITYQVQEQ